MNRPLTGRGVLFWLIGFFAFIFAVNIVFIAVSVDTFRGEDEQKPYLQGIEYNQTLAKRAEQARLGWHASITAARLVNGHVRLAIAITGAGKAEPKLAAELRHPADENRDRQLRVVDAGNGHYWADAGTVRSGAWDVILTSADDKRPFEATARLWLP